ncbi:MAG: fasciclin domain-containing protein [Bacteroidaceae bacterium]|nr:fasciclin domain-containing protein [Bacteroidaceae bacterium]
MKLYRLFSIALVAGAILLGGSCVDKVDESDMYTFKGKTVLGILESNDDYSYYVDLLGKVHFTSREESSTAAQLLSARGNYTVFAPDNAAIQAYLDSLYNTTGYPVSQISDSLATSIVKNSIIDTGDREAYFSTDFNSGVLDVTNLDDRFIAIDFQPTETKTRIVINSSSTITRGDNQASNGVVHGIDRVLEFTNSSLAELIKQTPNLQIFGELLRITHWQDSLTKYRDMEYEKTPHGPGIFYDGITNYHTISPEHRYFGYTAFVETDSVLALYWQLPAIRYQANGAIENWDEVYDAVLAKCKQLYPNATSTDPTDENNALNKFIAYHLLPERIRWDQIVLHHCEMGYGYGEPSQLGVDCYEYYETMGYQERRLMKITEGAQSDGKRINRKVIYDYGENGDKLNVKTVVRPGILITENNGNYIHQALNGFYYLISEPLVYDQDVPNLVLNERLRWDYSSLVPEIMTNNLRNVKSNTFIALDANYFDHIRMTEATHYKYNSYYTATVENYQGDEHNINGQYDFTIELPPVPFRGTYEFRISVAHGGHLGMAQLYIGKDPDRLHACGLPVDLRRDVSADDIGYKLDGPDWEVNRQVDKDMRLRGWMRPPQHDGIKTGYGTPPQESMRSSVSKGPYARLRYVVYTGTFDPADRLYMRVKNVLENPAASFEIDILEYCPKSIYAGEEAEDIW